MAAFQCVGCMSQHHFSADNSSQSKYSACDHLPDTSNKPINSYLKLWYWIQDIIGILQQAKQN